MLSRRLAPIALLLAAGCGDRKANSASTAEPSMVVAPPKATCSAGGDPFRRGADLVGPYMLLDGRPARNSPSSGNELRRGIACLDEAIRADPQYWQALWIRGKAYQALGEHRSARDSFKGAFDIQPQNPDVGRELVMAHLDLREHAQALPIAQKLVEAFPDNPGLRANYGIVLLLNGKLAEAQDAVAAALRADPSDEITMALQSRVEQVVRGERPPPADVHELERQP